MDQAPSSPRQRQLDDPPVLGVETLGSPRPTLDRLPPELQIIIIGYLTRWDAPSSRPHHRGSLCSLASTSAHWHALAAPFIWHRDHVPLRALVHPRPISNRFGDLVSLVRVVSDESTSSLLGPFLRGFPGRQKAPTGRAIVRSIKRLSLTQVTTIRDFNVKHAADESKLLNIPSERVMKLKAAVLRALGWKCPNIRDVHIASWEPVDEQLLTALAGFNSMTDLSIDRIANHLDYSPPLYRWVALRTVRLSWADPSQRDPDQSQLEPDSLLVDGFSVAPYLESLTIVSNSADTSIFTPPSPCESEESRRFPRLKHLTISPGRRFDVGTLRTHLPALERLVLSYRGRYAVIRRCLLRDLGIFLHDRLRSLTIATTAGLPDGCAFDGPRLYMGDVELAIRPLQLLRSFTFRPPSVVPDREDDPFIESIATHHTDLENLDVYADLYLPQMPSSPTSVQPNLSTISCRAFVRPPVDPTMEDYQLITCPSMLDTIASQMKDRLFPGLKTIELEWPTYRRCW